ncbi:MAG: hypothetical protein LBS36_13585 [Oscillospiraceae bacterium]|jgi:NTP pyrophosphatase (non-canonical NTP hydrolase)|nr:hypothetical protein [Oscillospiraceae bacterium]
MTNINQLAKEIHENAVEKGWWEEEPSFAEIIALCHSELSEALEEYRDGNPNLYCKTQKTEDCICDCESCDVVKPEGIAVELADCVIRILDWCGKEGIDMNAIINTKHQYNKTRPYRHGGKRI